jgi:hypothetical protein
MSLNDFTDQEIEVAARRIGEETGRRPRKAEILKYLLENVESSSSSSSDSSSSGDVEEIPPPPLLPPEPAPKLRKEYEGPGEEVKKRLDQFENVLGEVINEKGTGLREPVSWNIPRGIWQDFGNGVKIFHPGETADDIRQRLREENERRLARNRPPPPEDSDSEDAKEHPAEYRYGWTPQRKKRIIEMHKRRGEREAEEARQREILHVQELEKIRKRKEAEKRKVQRERDENGRKGEGYAYPERTYVRSKEQTKARREKEAAEAERIRKEVEAEAERVRREAEKVARKEEKLKKGMETAERHEVGWRRKVERNHRLRGL